MRQPPLSFVRGPRFKQSVQLQCDESARPAPRARQPSARSPPALQYSNHVQRYYLLAPEVEPEVVHTADMDSAHMRSSLHRALSWQQWSRPSRPAEHSHLRSHPPFEPKSSRSCCTTRPLRRRRRPACGACLSGERARVRAAHPRAVRVPCMYRASGCSRGPLGGLSCSLDKVLLGLLHRKFHRHLGRLGRLVHRAELGCIGDGGAQRGLERRATRRRVRALVDALLRWE